MVPCLPRRTTSSHRDMGREPGRVEAALWANGAADLVHDPGAALHEDLWPLARATGDGLGVQREWAAKPARHLLEPITVEDVLNSLRIAYPFVTRTQYRVSGPLRLSLFQP